MTRRVLTTVCVLCVLAWAHVASGEGPRIEVGLGGYFPLGGWVRCRVSGLADVAAGRRIVVHVGETFHREMTVTGGVAEGLVLMTEELPRIAVAMPDGTRIELPDEATRHLRAVRDRLPAVMVGSDVPDNATADATIDGVPVMGIRMTPAEFATRDLRDLEWVHVFVLGPMTSSEREALRENVVALVRLKGAVVTASPEQVTGWMRQLPFEEVSDRVSACNFEHLSLFAAPRGPLRPELFDIFGAVEWPRSVRPGIVMGFVAVLLVTAASLVLPGRLRWLGWIGVAAVGVGVTCWVTLQVRTPTERVEIVERVAGSHEGVRTRVTSRAILRRGPGGCDRVVVTDSPAQPAPVVCERTYLVEHPISVDAAGVLHRTPRVPGREVFLEVSAEPVTEPTEDLVVTDGRRVWTDAAAAEPPADAVDFDDHLATRHHDDARVEALRDATLRYWKDTRGTKTRCLVGWTRALRKPHELSAGTLVVTHLIAVQSP